MKKTILAIYIILISYNTFPQTPLVIAPHFEAKDFNGNPHSLYDYLDDGKYVLLSFFTTSCGTCSIFNPHVNMAYNNFGCNTGNLIVLGINWGSTNQVVAQYHQDNGLSFPALSGFDGYGNQTTTLYEIASFISVILIAPDREIIEQYIYPPSITTLDSVLNNYGINPLPCALGTENEFSGNNYEFSVFPNPATTQLHLNVSLADPNLSSINIYDMTGGLVLNFKPNSFNSSNNYIILPLLTLHPGFYFCEIETPERTIPVRKFIILPR